MAKSEFDTKLKSLSRKINSNKNETFACRKWNSWITEWKSKEFSNESLEVVSKTDNTLTPTNSWFDGEQNQIQSWKNSKDLHCLWNY